MLGLVTYTYILAHHYAQVYPYGTMITFRVDVLARKRGFENPSQLAMKAGIAYPVAYRAWHMSPPFGRVDFKVLTRLCRVLNCQPGELLSYSPDGQE